MVLWSEVSVDSLKFICSGIEHHSEGDLDLLEIIGARDAVDLSGLGFDFVDDRPLQPWHHQVPSFCESLFATSRESVELEGSLCWLDLVHQGFTADPQKAESSERTTEQRELLFVVHLETK